MLKLATTPVGAAADAVQNEGDEARTPEIIRFERRREPRARTDGWAQVLCCNPLHTLLGGSMRLLDISPIGVGLLSDHALHIGEFVEIRLAPFRTRGAIGTVVRCDPAGVDADGQARYRIAVAYPRRRAA
ncbi:MAG: PilZ domain-containing protein [Phycisphaerales bacterium]